ncbi:MAG TPA: hypothetical protein VIM30_18115 [Candidatus Limnocylindrales bacterium]|jgi:hypothetical protein
MVPNDARRHAREVAGLADELSVRLRVLEESGATLQVHVDARPIGPGGGGLASLASTGIEVPADADIEALEFIVMMEAAKSAQDDLKAILAAVKSINVAKNRLSSELEKARARGSSTSGKNSPRRGSADLDALLQVLLTAYGIGVEQEGERLINDLDSMSELGEIESLRLQMAMDRMSKMMSTLSNLLKKIADANQQIVQNLK